jgi:hypothetical protein
MLCIQKLSNIEELKMCGIHLLRRVAFICYDMWHSFQAPRCVSVVGLIFFLRTGKIGAISKYG